MKTEVLCVFADLGVFARNPASPVRFIMEYASLNPGRDLDALVAERVFGVKYQLIHGDYSVEDPEDPIAYLVCPDYSTNIVAAFQVEERIEEMGLSECYAYALVETVIPNSAFGFLNRGALSRDIFAMVHASPAHRCIAALVALSRQTANV